MNQDIDIKTLNRMARAIFETQRRICGYAAPDHPEHQSWEELGLMIRGGYREMAHAAWNAAHLPAPSPAPA